MRRPGPYAGDWRSRSASLLVGMATIGGAGLIAVPTASAVPQGRAYELVSPADDPSGAIGGLTTDLLAAPAISSDDGNTLLYGSGSSVGSSWSGPPNPMIFGYRTPTGWQVRSAMRSLDDGNTPLELASGEAQSGRLTPDGSSFVFGVPGNFGATPVPPGSSVTGVFRSRNADDTPDWLSQPLDGISPLQAPTNILTVSTSSNRDADVVTFSSTARLMAIAPPSGTSAVYAVYNGELQLVSRMPDDTPATQPAFLANTSNANAGAVNPPAVIQRNQLAGNGRFVLFRLGGNENQGALYVRDLQEQETRQLSGGLPGATEVTASMQTAWGAANQNVAADAVTVPVGALAFGARDGARAFFRGQRNVAVAAFLYEADLESGTVTPRPALTGAPLGLSPDGGRMLFLEPPSTGSAAGDWTLRFWDATNPGTSVAVGTITSPSTATFGRARVFRSSPDGSTWIFTAIGSPDPLRPNVTPTTQQLYRWKVGEAAPTCLSCEPVDGVARTSGVNLTVQEGIATEKFVSPTTAGVPTETATGLAKRKLSQPGHSVSDDGRWILFDSPDRLVDQDTNNVRDVYLWDGDAPAGERLALVTSGEGNTPSYALDLDPTGTNAFFATREGLVPADRNENYNVYSARIGGGFPGSPTSCVGEACRPPVIPDPPTGHVGSQGAGPVSTGRRQPVQSGTPTFRVRSVRTSSRRLTVRVTTPKAGRIRISGKQVRTTSRTAKRATTYTVRVPLTASARRSVATKGRLKVALRVRFTPAGAKKSTTVNTSVSVKRGR